jgi:hypothetical protein
MGVLKVLTLGYSEWWLIGVLIVLTLGHSECSATPGGTAASAGFGGREETAKRLEQQQQDQLTSPLRGDPHAEYKKHSVSTLPSTTYKVIARPDSRPMPRHAAPRRPSGPFWAACSASVLTARPPWRLRIKRRSRSASRRPESRRRA